MTNYIIYGLGISGISTAKYLLHTGNKVALTDDNDSAIEAAKKKLEPDLAGCDSNIKFLPAAQIENECGRESLVVFAPGIPLYHPKPHKILEIVARTGAQLLCDVELFYLLNREKTFVGITGTNGKSTTTALTGFVFEQLNVAAQIGGNIGVPCFELASAPKYVFEVSSYHLDLMQKSHFKVAALTNITPDHIDRHGSFENYVAAKKKIFANQTAQDFAVVGVDNDASHAVFDALKNDKTFKAALIAISTRKICENGVSIIDGVLYNKIGGADQKSSLAGLILKGEHNMQNIAVAFANVYATLCHEAKNLLELQESIVNAIKKFKGLRHRMQFLGAVEGVNFVNDSKATNAESTENALKSYENIFWILGGKAKDGGISSLKPYFKKITKAYLIGEASDEFAAVLQENSVQFEKCVNLQNAFAAAFLDAKKSSLKERNVLLSPACASFDQWKNFEERGDYFCKAFDEINKA